MWLKRATMCVRRILVAVGLLVAVTACGGSIDNSAPPYIATSRKEAGMQALIDGVVALTDDKCLGLRGTTVVPVMWPKGTTRAKDGVRYHGHVYRIGDSLTASGGGVSLANAKHFGKLPKQCRSTDSVLVIDDPKPSRG